MLRFRFFLPLMAPVLAVIGWWLYTSRKKKEIVAPKEEKEGLAAHELASPCQVGNGAVEGSRVKLEEVNVQQEIVDKNHVPIATAVMLGQSLPIKTLGGVGTLSHAHSSSHTGDSDGNDPESESSEQEVTFKPPVPSLRKTGIEKAGQDDLSRSECQLLHGDKQVIVASEHGPEAELAVANEEQEQLAPPPSQSRSAAISPTLAQLTEAEGNDDAVNIMVPSPEDLQTAALVEPIHSLNEDLPFTELQTSTGRMPDLLFPKTDITSSHILAPLASQPMLEAEVPPQQEGFGEPLASGQPSEPAQEESKGPILGLNREVISVATQEVRLHGDVGEDGDGRTSDQNNSFSLIDGTDCTTVEQVEWENSQTSTAVTCLLEDHRDEHENDQMSSKSDLLVNGPSLSASVDVHHEGEKVRNGCLAPLVPEGEKEDVGSSRTESGQKSPRPELTPPCPDDDVTERKDCGFDTCHSEDRVSNEDQLSTLGLSHKVPEKDDDPVLSTVTSPGSNEQKHSPERTPEPSLERGHQEATLSWGESATNTDPYDASLTDKEIEAVHSREIPLAAPREVPAVSHSESAGEEVHQTSCEQSSSCVITNGTQCTEPDQALQKSDLANRTQCSVSGQKEQENDHTDGTQCVALDQHEQENGQPSETQCMALDQTRQEEEQTSSGRQPIPQVPTEVTGDGVFQNGRCTAPVGQKVEDDAASSGRTDSGEKNPRPTPSPPSTDKPQTDDGVTETEDSGCGTCQSEDGLSSEDQHPASGLSREVPERDTDPVCASVTSQSSEEQRTAQSHSPERASEPCHQEACLSGGEKLSDTDLRNGSHSENETEVDHSKGSEVNIKDPADCSFVSGMREGQGSSCKPARPQNLDLVIWEVEVPKLLVGRLIGKRGRYVSFLKQTSGAKVYISSLPYTQDIQICHIEGSKQQVDKVLGLIGKKFKELNLTNLYAPPPPPPVTFPSLPVTSWLLLPDGITVEVSVVKIVSASHMFVQQPKHPSYPALSGLDRDMLLCYAQPAPCLPSPTEAGVICAAPGVNGAWWRAQVISFQEESDEAEIRYVDYGGYERVKMDTLRQIRSDFVTLPFQGAEVVLNSVKPLPGDDGFSAEASAALEEMTRGASLLAQVTGYDGAGIPFVQMWRVVEGELVSVNRALVDRGLATWLDSF